MITMKKKNNGLTRDEAIRLEAYLLSEKAGHPTGMEQFFWQQAEALVQKRSTTAPRSKKNAAATAPVALAAAAPIAAPKSRVKKSDAPVVATPKKQAPPETIVQSPALPKPASAKRAAAAKKTPRTQPVAK